MLIAGRPPRLIDQWLDRSEEHMAEVMHYIEANRAAFVREYQEVLEQAEDNRCYWEARNRGRFPALVAQP